MKKLIKLIAVLLSFALVVSVVPIVSAESNTSVEPTVSTLNEPYIIGELTEKRTETTKHFLMSDRSVMAAVYDQAVHYNDGNAWVDIDNSFSTNTDNEFENESNIFKTKFSKKSNGNKLVTLKKDNYSLSWMLSDANKVNAQVSDGNQNEIEDKSALKNLEGYVTYPDIQENVDLQYVVTGSDVKENIVLKDKDTPLEFTFQYKFNKLKYRTNDENQIEFYDENDSENIVFIIDTPYMYDSDKACSNDIEMQVEETNKGLTLTLIPDEEWLLSEDRVYPIVIDPTTLSKQEAKSVWDIDMRSDQSSAFNYKAGDFLVGSNTNGQVYRSLLKFIDLPDIGVDGIVVGAVMEITTYQGPGKTGDPALRTKPTDDIQVNIHRMTANWPEQGATWNGYANECHPIIDEYFIYNDTDIYFSANITEIVAGWYSGEFPNYGVLIKAADETAANHVMQFASSDWCTNDSEYAVLRPCLYVNYRSSTGIEDYWSFTSQDMGGYGTGYVNNFNGNFIYTHNDANFVSEINGFSVSHVYNTSTVNDTGTRYGKGWGINLIQTFKPITIDGNEYVKYEYTDGDGTKHYFVQTDDGKIVDEDGLGYTFTAISETTDSGATPLSYKITTKDDCVLKFDAWGFLRRIIDTNGNTISLHYSPGATMDKNYLSVVNTTSGGYIRFVYSGDQLSKIIDTAGRETTYTYSGGNLTRITYPDTTYLQFAYSSGVANATGSTSWLKTVTLPNGFKYCYENYDNGKIKTVTTQTSSGTQGNKLQFGYKNNETHVTDSSGRKATYQFDSWGRVTCVYDSEGNSYLDTYTPTVSSSSGIFANNKISTSSGNIKYINNLAPDGAFLNGLDLWGTHTDAQSQTQISTVTDQAYISSKSIKITTTSYGTHAIRKDLTTTTGKKYTLSANIKTENVESNTSQGAALKINTNKGTYYSEFVTGTTNAEINNGFVTLSLTPNLASDEKITSIAVGLHGAKGTVFIDSVQLEEGDTANKINLVINSGFENGITGFTANATNSENGVNTEIKKSGNYSLKMVGITSRNYNYSQVVGISGKAGDVYSFGAWAMASSVPEAGDLGRYKMVCEFTYTDNTTSRETIEYNTLVNDWQYGAKNIMAQKDYSKLTLYLCYNKNCNTAFYDSVFLYRDVMQSYTYDSNGNVVSTADYANQQSSYNYNGTSLSKILNPDGTSYEYGYDENNNMVISRSNIGLQTDIKYDSNGNPTSTIISADNYSATIQSGKTYYIRLKGSGKYLAVEGSGTSNSTNVCQENFTGNDNQKWRVEKAITGGYYLYPQNADGMGLGVGDNTSAGYANAAIYTHNTSESQRFAIIPQSDYTYKIVTQKQNDGKIITVENSPIQNNVTSFPPQGELNADQSWYFEDASISKIEQIEDGAIYQLRARHSGRYVSVSNQETANGTYLVQCAQGNLDSQKFIIKKCEGTDNYTLSPVNAPEKFVNVTSTVTSYECKYIEITNSNTATATQFEFVYNAQKDVWQICPEANPNGECFAVAFSDCKDNAQVVCADIGTSDNRYFVLEKVSQSITSSIEYQNYGNFIETTTDSRGNTTTYTYDTARGTQTSVTDAKQNTTTYSYNQNNDRLNYVESGNSKVSYTYDNVGILNNITSPSGTVYSFTYDGFGNVTKTLVGSRTLSENTYNTTRGLLTKTTYGNGHVVNYTYDTLDRVTQKMYNNGIKVNYRYDKFGNLYELHDGFTGTTYRYSYDLTGRIIGIKGSNGIGLDYIYDNLNRVVKYATTFNGITNNTEYVYGSSDIAGQYDGLIYGVKLNGTQKISYSYDQLARLNARTIATATPFTTNYTYLDGVGGNTTTLVKTVQNGSDTYEYSYDELGNITEIKLNGTVYESYEYDHLGQLTKVTRGGEEYIYTYDNGGNIQSVKKDGTEIKKYTYGDSTWKDLLTKFNEQTITYDNIGNPLQYRDGFNFSWSNGRQLTGITKGTDSISYLYNADGLRTSKTVNGTTTDYYWLNGVLLGQKTGNDYITYLYDENGTPYGIICNNSYYYYVFNAQGDVVGIINSDGTQVVQYDYSAWGEVLSVTDSTTENIGQLNPIRYRGYYYDSETGFYYLQSRYYDPVTQRFLNADGLVSTGQGILATNMFAYCLNNPVNMSDSFGNWPTWATIAIIAVVAVVVVATIVAVAIAVTNSDPSDDEVYETQEEATESWKSEYKGKSEEIEHGAFIYETTDPDTQEKTYSIGRTYEGTENNVILGFIVGYFGGGSRSIFSNKKISAFIHSHPDDKSVLCTADPSNVDISLLILPGISEVYVVPWDPCDVASDIVKCTDKNSWNHECCDFEEEVVYVSAN